MTLRGAVLLAWMSLVLLPVGTSAQVPTVQGGGVNASGQWNVDPHVGGPSSSSPLQAASSPPHSFGTTDDVDSPWASRGAPLSFWVRGEYLMWWLKDQGLPPLVTTSASQPSVGRLGFADTNVLYGGDVDGKMRDGFRLTLGGSMLPIGDNGAATLGIEGSFFLLAQHGNNFDASSNGDTVLARPFVDALTGTQRVEQVANLRLTDATGAVIARAVTGSVSVSNPSSMWGAEIHGLLTITDQELFTTNVLLGARYLYLQERLDIGDNLVQPADPTIGVPKADFLVGDHFRTRNDFFGAQLGLRGAMSLGNFNWELTSKVAIGSTRQMVDINGETTAQVAGSAPVTNTGGLLALPTNIGSYSRDRITVVPEVGLIMGYQFLPSVRGFVGYNFLYWSSVVRPGPQVDTVVNPNYLPPATVPTTGPARPAFLGTGTDLWVQGMTLGLEFSY